MKLHQQENIRMCLREASISVVSFILSHHVNKIDDHLTVSYMRIVYCSVSRPQTIHNKNVVYSFDTVHYFCIRLAVYVHPSVY